MIDAAVNAARSVVRRALAPVLDSMLEAWANSRDLGRNVQALRMELMCVSAMLDANLMTGIDNLALQELLKLMLDTLYDAKDAFEKLDYFRIQDNLDDASASKGCAHNLVFNAHRTAKAVGKMLCLPTCSSVVNPAARRMAHGNKSEADREVNTKSIVHAVSNCFPCSSLPHDIADDNDAQQRKHVEEAPVLTLNRSQLFTTLNHITEQLQSIRQRVSSIIIAFRPSGMTVAVSSVQNRPATTSLSIEPKLYGRNRWMNTIIDDITKGKYCEENLSVIPIVGPGGIGKTTLTQHIYNSAEVQAHFEVMVWICVSTTYDTDKLIAAIGKCIPKVEDEKGGTAGELIGQRLYSKRFLLVLDDMWTCGNEAEWIRLLLPFKRSQVKGNIIIVTTRIPALAQMVESIDSSIFLQGLDNDELKQLFLDCVFGDEQSIKDHKFLLEVGYKIVEKLKGSPLAAKTVARFLRNHLDLEHWIRVLESKEWDQQTNENDIMPALKLSYDYLPFHLQECFWYCALFPEDYEFDSKELIYYWIGLDILHSDSGHENKAVEDIGLIRLNELVTCGFLQKKEKDDSCPFYVMNDLLHELALRVAAYDCLIIDRYNVRSIQIQPIARHLSIVLDHTDDTDDQMFMEDLRILTRRLKVENLHTLMIFGELDENFAHYFGDFLGKANGLRILHLSRMSVSMESMLQYFSSFSQLRYLRLGMIYISGIHLPSMLSRFYHLRILDLQAWGGRLDLPSDMSNLTVLRHFLTKDDEVHSKICNVGKLQFLQELKKFRVNKDIDGFELKQIGNLKELRELGIYNLEKIQTEEEAAEAQLINKHYLQKLTLDWHNEVPKNERDVEGVVLESLQPHRNLQEFCIRGHGSRSCPTWLGSKLSLKALQSLHLDGIAWEVLPSFDQMLMLQELTLKDMDMLTEFVPDHFGCITGQRFCNLNRLTLIGLKVLKKWVLGDDHYLFPRLQVLIIRDCPEILGVPVADNICYPTVQVQEREIQWLPKLQKLEINNCPKVGMLPPIPWTPTLLSVKITDVGSLLLDELEYSKSSSNVKLTITGKNDLHSLDERVIAFNNLTDLQELMIVRCGPMVLKHIQMLASLKRLTLENSSQVLVPSESVGDVKWKLPIENLCIHSCGASGKELTELLTHLPMLSSLAIQQCRYITQMGVALDQEQPTPLVSSSVVRPEMGMEIEAIDSALATYYHKQVVETEELATYYHKQVVEMEELEKLDDGLLLFPAHLSESLQVLLIHDCPELRLVVALPHHPNNHMVGRGTEGLQALRSLQELAIDFCPKVISAYETSFFPFPSSLQKLYLSHVKGMRTLDALSNFMSLTQLEIRDCGDDLSGEGLWYLITFGQLSKLVVIGCPSIFICLDPMWVLQNKDQEQHLRCPPKLQMLQTSDIAGVLVVPICKLLSSSLTKLDFCCNEEVDRFTKEQEDALQLLTSLQDLRFQICFQLECLPEGLHTLHNLKILEVRFCPFVSSLPKDGLPISMQELHVSSCDNKELKQDCRNFIMNHPGIKLTT